MRTAFGLVSRDENLYVHEPNERFLARLPAELAEEIRRSPMGYAWPVDDVMGAFSRLHADWHGRDDRIRIVTAPDWTPACSDDLYRRARRVADEHDTGHDHARAGDPGGDDVQPGASREAGAAPAGRPGRARSHDGARALRLGHRRGARDLRRLGRGGLERPRLQPPAVHRHLPGARHHGHGRTDRVRHGRHLVLRPRGLLPGTPPGVLPAAHAHGVRAPAAGQRGRAARRRRERRAGARHGGPAGQPGARALRRPVDRGEGPDHVPAGPLRRRAVPGRGARPRRRRRHRHRDGARARPDGGRARDGGGRGRAQGAVRRGGAAQGLPASGPRATLGRAGAAGGALRDRVLPALVRHARGARLPLQPAERPRSRPRSGPGAARSCRP